MNNKSLERQLRKAARQIERYEKIKKKNKCEKQNMYTHTLYGIICDLAAIGPFELIV